MPVSISCVVEEITARKTAEELRRQSEELFMAVIDNSPGAVVIKDMEFRNIIANKRFCDWYGTSAENILGKTAGDFLAKEAADPIAAQEREVMDKGTTVEEERQITYPDGVSRQVLSQKFPIPNSNCSAPGSLDTSLSHAAGLIEIAACHA